MPKILDTALQDPEVLRDLRVALAADRVRRGGKDPTALMRSSERRQVLAQKRALLLQLNLKLADLREGLATQQIKSTGELRKAKAQLWLDHQRAAVDLAVAKGTIGAKVHATFGSAFANISDAIEDNRFVKHTDRSEAAAANRAMGLDSLKSDLEDQLTHARHVADDLKGLPESRGTASYLEDLNAARATYGLGTIETLVKDLRKAYPKHPLVTQYDSYQGARANNEKHLAISLVRGKELYDKVLRGAGVPDIAEAPPGLLPTDADIAADEEKLQDIADTAIKDSGLQDLIDQTMAEEKALAESLPLDPDQVESRLANSEGIAEIADTLGITREKAVKYAKRQYKQVDRGKREAFTPEDAKLRQFGKATRKAHRQERRAARKAGEEPEEFKAEASTPEEAQKMIDASKGVKRGTETGALLEAIDLGAAAEIPESPAAAAVSGAEPEVDEVQLAADKAKEEFKERQAAGASRTKQLLASLSETA